jgi:stage II sporulation protein D
MSGIRTAFLSGMAAAMLAKLFLAGGGVSESGGIAAGSGADREKRVFGTVEAGRTAEPAMAEDGAAGGRRSEEGQTGNQEVSRPPGDAGPAGMVGPSGLPDRRSEDGNAPGRPEAGQAGEREEPLVRVYLAGERRVESVPLETYVRGVVAGEMPAGFETEALKAQAIAARTYIVRKLLTEARDGGAGREYDVTDGEGDQAYVPLERMRQLERERKDDMERIERAVAETEGLVLVYDGEPIQAVYFSTSGGYTENAEDYWSAEVPYLRSVPSPWDALLSPRFEQEIEMGLEEFYDRLGIDERDRKGGIEVLGRTAGRSVKEIRIGKRILTGREVREALDLPSANFSLSIRDGRIRLICRGHGHGVGMSQYGAQALALAGNDAERILAWYYRGARLIRSENLAAPSESFKT